jgi:carbonic anhydrase/acetyltransferase-like protein (isoleucine patch superfamily)
METKKFILTDEKKDYLGTTLYRIKAIRAFGNIKEGELGGWIESESNLSHEGNAWVGDNAKVIDKARVSGNAMVYGNAYVGENACVCGNACVSENAKIFLNAWVGDNAKVYGAAWVSERGKVYGTAKVYGIAKVYGNAEVYGNARVGENAMVSGDAEVYSNARVFGNAHVEGNAIVYGNARVCNDSDYLVFKDWWHSGKYPRYLTWTRSNNKWRYEGFYGTSEELIKKAYADSEKIGREYERMVKYVESILADEKEG